MLVQQALARPDRRIAILTYTLQNLEEIRHAFEGQVGGVPTHVTLYSWYGFLLRECIRPYQSALCAEPRIESLHFVEGRTASRAPRTQVRRYYLVGNRILSDRAADFALRCDDLSHGRVAARLATIFDELYIDEVQDLAGYDLDLVERLLKTSIAMTLVGDIRQATYATNHSARNQSLRGHRMAQLFDRWQAQGLCQIDNRAISFRCVQPLCDLADSLYPQMPKTQSGNATETGHDGIFVVAPEAVERYVREFNPTVLRYDRRHDCLGMPAINFGESKGRTYFRVLVFPNGPISRLLQSGEPATITSPAKYYVAFTRARQSLAFVVDGACALPAHHRYEPFDSPEA